MAQTYVLDRVVKIVNDDFGKPNSEQVLVFINPETGKAVRTVDINGDHRLEKEGLLARRRPRRQILVSNNRDRRNEVRGQIRGIQLRDFQGNLYLNILVTYLVSCDPGNEIKVAENLSVGAHPGAALQDLIVRWVKDYEKQNQSAVLTSFYSHQGQLEANLARRADEEISLNLQVTISLEAEEEALKTIEIAPTNISVRVRDFPEKQNVRLKAELGVDESRKIFAVLYRNHIVDFESLVKEQIADFFASNVSLHGFQTQLQTASFRQPLLDAIDAKLRAYGRKLDFLSLAGSGIRQPPEFKEFEHDVRYKIQGKEEVIIKNAVQMMLQDSALFNMANVADLKSWVIENLTETVQQVLFDKQYIDLLIGFDSSKEEIRAEFTQRALTIGYSIKQLVTGPDLEPYQWLKNFTLKIEESFDVKNSRRPVKLSIVITLRINNLRDVENYLNHQQHVPDEMQAAVIAEAKAFLHTIDPERFYLRFSYTDQEGEESVESTLDKKIRKRLNKDFKADIVSVTIAMGETEITRLHDELRRTPGDFRLDIKSFASGEPYQVVYTGSFRVEGVHYEHWDRFQSSNPTIDAIRSTLERHLISELKVLRREVLGYRTRAQQKEVVGVIQHLGRQQILAEFGLAIAISMVSREITGDEAIKQKETRRIYELAQVHSQRRIAEVMGTISTLKTKRLELITGDADADEIKEVEVKITTLESELPVDPLLLPERFEILDSPRQVQHTELAEYYDQPPPTTRALSAGNSNGNKESE